jgi:hypothetical protein
VLELIEATLLFVDDLEDTEELRLSRRMLMVEVGGQRILTAE